MNELGLLGSKFRLVLNTNVVWYVVEIMLPKIHHFCISVPRITAEIVQFGPQQKQLSRTSMLEFSGMLTLELDLGLNTNVGAY
jgi:hypothetical protein